jgi:hypothetical protein
MSALVLLLQPLATAGTVANNWGITDGAHRCTEDPDRLSQCTAPDANDHRLMVTFIDTTLIKNEVLDTAYDDYDYKSSQINVAIVATAGAEDVRMFDGQYGTLNGARAWTTCAQGAATGNNGTFRMWCDPQLIFFNNGTYPLDWNSDAERRHHTCQEVGHTFGLRHRNSTSTCMYNVGLDFTIGINTTTHDIGCIVTGYVDKVRCP